jgi:hypothetical protein
LKPRIAPLGFLLADSSPGLLAGAFSLLSGP